MTGKSRHIPNKYWDYFVERQNLLMGVLVTLATFVFLGLTLVVDSNRDIILGSDQAYYYSYARSLIIDRDLDFTNEYLQLGVDHYELTRTGHPVNKYSIGFPLAVLPFFLLAHMLVMGANFCGGNMDASGYSTIYQLLYCLGSILYGYGGLIMALKLAGRYSSPSAALGSVVSIFLASNILYYFLREPFMSHLVSFFAAAHFIYWWLVSRSAPSAVRPVYFMGLSAGLMVVVRQQDAVFLIIPIVDGLLDLWGGKQRLVFLLRRGIRALAGALPFCLLQALTWNIIFGDYLVYSYGSESFVYARSPKVLEVLFSSRHGLFSWNPILLLACIGSFYFAWVRPREGGLLLVGLLLQVYINSSWFCWWFGHSFGHRAFISSLPIMVTGLSTGLDRLKVKYDLKWVGFLAVSLIGWNLIMILAYLSELIPYDDYFSWRELFMRLWNLPEGIMKKIHSLTAMASSNQLFASF